VKTKDLADLRKKDVDELHELLDARRAEVMDLRFSHATGALENPARMGQARRDVARILTVIAEKTREGATA
jgi:large subunit ribosomal protein L29